MWRCCFVGVYLFVLRKKIKPSNATFLSLCGEKRKKARIHFRKGAIVADTYEWNLVLETLKRDMSTGLHCTDCVFSSQNFLPLSYSHLLLYLRKGSEFREKTAKKFLNFNYVYGLGVLISSSSLKNFM